jgi:hypothetical protein
MAEVTYEQPEYDQHMVERDKLIDAARESLKTFDQAILAFGSAVFAASVAFIKDVAPKPLPYSIPWLCGAWLCFTIGLIAIGLSFLFSHQTCMARIEYSEARLRNRDAIEPKDKWGQLTYWCNYGCLGFLLLGVIAWITFAIENIAKSGGK